MRVRAVCDETITMEHARHPVSRSQAIRPQHLLIYRTTHSRDQTSNGSIYACGDVCSQYQFTHVADALARIVIRNALFFGRDKASSLLIPWTTFTEPEIAHVGVYERDLVREGVAFNTFTGMPGGRVVLCWRCCGCVFAWWW